MIVEQSDKGVGKTLLWRLALTALAIEAFLVALDVVSPLGGVSLSISPLAHVWPWLLAPSRAVFGDALVDGSVPGARGWPELMAFATLLVGASCAAGRAVLSAQRAPVTAVSEDARRWLLALALGGAALLGLTLALAPALPSDDIFSYIIYGRISVLYHANPLIATPAQFARDPFLAQVFWRNTRSVYGPAWLLLSSGVALLAQALGGSLVVYIVLFKMLGLLAHLANAGLIWLILGRLAPRRQAMGTLLYAWNPLCLLEFCASGHNDAVMLTFLLLGVYCLLRQWEVMALVAIGLSVATKYAPLALLPFYLAAVALWLTQRLRTQGASRRSIAWGVAWGL